jgi:hypothetical protein
MSFNFNVSTNIDITKKILKFISLLKLLKFKSFCNVNQHYLIIVLLPPPPPPPPSSPFFWGGRGGDGGEGTGGQGNGQGTIAPPPPERWGGDEVPPPSPPQDFTKNFFTQVKTYKNFFLSKYSNHLQNLCNLPTLEERRQSTAQNYKKKKLRVSSQQNSFIHSLWHTSMKFIIYPPPPTTTKYYQNFS